MYLSYHFVVTNCLDIFKSGVGACGEEVETCVGLLQWAKVAKGMGGMGIWWAIWCVFFDCPCIGHITSLKVCVICAHVHLGADQK